VEDIILPARIISNGPEAAGRLCQIMENIEPNREKSDAELVSLALANRDDFLYIVDRYRPQLLSYIRRLTNIRPPDAEDLLQEIFIKVYLNLNDFDRKLKFSSWIYRIAHNQVISSYRKLKARPEGNEIDWEEPAIRRIMAESDVAGQADQSFLQEAVALALGRLPDKYREVLILRFQEEKSYQEIADIIKKPGGTVASWLNKAKEAFREEFPKHFQER